MRGYVNNQHILLVKKLLEFILCHISLWIKSEDKNVLYKSVVSCFIYNELFNQL